MTDLLSRLPHVRGAYHPAARLAQHTWFGVGGPADVLPPFWQAVRPIFR